MLRPDARFTLALSLSALLHLGWLVLPEHARPVAPVAKRTLQVRFATAHFPYAPVVAPPPEKAAAEAPVVPDNTAPPPPGSLPDWLAALGPEADPTYYPTPELEQPSMPQQPIDLDAGQANPPLQEGRALLDVKIDEFGAVDDVSILDAQPPTLLLDAAIAAFKAAHFSPAVRGGKFVKSRKTIEVCFGQCGVPIPAPADRTRADTPGAPQ
jgi:TonB family protein